MVSQTKELQLAKEDEVKQLSKSDEEFVKSVTAWRLDKTEHKPIDFSKLTAGNFRDRPPFEQVVEYVKEGVNTYCNTIGDPDNIDRRAIVTALLEVAQSICHMDPKWNLVSGQLELIKLAIKPIRKPENNHE
jgi:hypothetical protein